MSFSAVLFVTNETQRVNTATSEVMVGVLYFTRRHGITVNLLISQANECISQDVKTCL